MSKSLIVDFWRTWKGIQTRLADLAHNLTWSAVNTAVKEQFLVLEAEDQKKTGEKSGRKLHYSTAEDDRVCELCEDNEGDYDPDSPFLPDLPQHVNCLPGYTHVSSTSRITGATKREYDGDLIIIHTATNRHLALTPNHPVLTPHGWVPARLLKKGSQVVCESRRNSRFRFHRNHQNMPTRIEQVADAFLMMPTTLRLEVPTAPKDFNGDGINSKVTIVGTNRHLMPNHEAALRKQLSKLSFIVRDMQLFEFTSFRNFHQHLQATFLAFSRYMRGLNLSLSLLTGHLTPLQSLGFMLVPNVNSHDEKTISDCPTTDMKLISQRFLGCSRQVFLDNIVDVKRNSKFHGNIYNLETPVGYFNAEGIFVHNCRCFWEISV